MKILISRLIRSRGFSHYVDAAAVFVEQNLAIFQREQCPITADADVFARHKFAAALADDDAAGGNKFTAKCFHAQPLADAITSVADAALTFFMCHISVKSLGVKSKLDFFYLNHRQLLAVADGFMITLAAFHFERKLFLAALVRDDVGDDGGA